MKPLLAHVYEPHRVTYPCYVQPKLNGIRALYQNGCFQSRDELPFPTGLLDHLAVPLRKVFGPEVILDGELYRHGWPLQRILSAVTPVRGEPNEDTAQVEYHVFDVVDFEKNFHERFTRIAPSVHLPERRHGAVRFVQWDMPDSPEEADRFYSRVVADGYEGMMYRLDGPYTIPKQRGGKGRSGFLSDKDNRCWHLLKRKDWQEMTVTLYGITRTEGAKGFDGFQVFAQTPGGVSFKLGSGLSASEVDRLIADGPFPCKAEIEYLTLSLDGVPQNATITKLIQ